MNTGPISANTQTILAHLMLNVGGRYQAEKSHGPQPSIEGIAMCAEDLLVEDAANAELRNRVKQSLGSQHFASFRNLDVGIVGDSVILDGALPSFHERQLAVALCQHVPGVHRVIDRIFVPESTAIRGSTEMRRRPK